MSGGQSISPIDSLGYGGMYASDPAMMAAMSGYNSGGYGSYGMYGGYGMGMPMYNEQMVDSITNYMQKMNNTQYQIEAQRLQHATDMHALTQQAEVFNLSAHDNAFFQKAMLDGYVQKDIRAIYDAIREGDTNEVLQKIFDLKNGILVNYSEYFNSAQGQKNTRANLDRLIQLLYTKIAGAYDPTNPYPDLIHDIKVYSEDSIKNGFNSTLLGRHGHNDLTGEEVLNQAFGTRINDAGSKHRAHQVGAWGARGAEFGLLAPAVGATAGLAAGGAVYGITKAGAAVFGQASKVKLNGKVALGVTALAALVTQGLDLWWQCTRA